MPRERKNDTPSDSAITPRILAEQYDTTAYKVRKELRKHAGELEHAKNSRWGFGSNAAELSRAHEILTERFGEPLE